MFYGGAAPEEVMQAYMKEWGDYIEGIAKDNRYEGGLPCHEKGMRITGPDNKMSEVAGGHTSTSGYMVIKAKDMDEALMICGKAPHQKYGGHTDVRECMEM